MKKRFTHSLAFLMGVALVILWPGGESQRKSRATDVTMDRDQPPRSPVSRVRAAHATSASAEIDFMNPKPVTASDLQLWLEKMAIDPQSRAESLVAAGILTGNPDLIRQGIEADPDNPHLLFLGATNQGFSIEERISFGQRMQAHDPDNAMASYLTASALMENGDAPAAIACLRDSIGQAKVDSYMFDTVLLLEDAYRGAGYSPDDAKVMGLYDTPIGHISEMRSMMNSLKEQAKSASSDEAIEIRTLGALTGKRLREEASPGSLTNQIAGLSFEKQALEGMPDDAASPYEGLTVREARDAITAEREEIRNTIQNFPDPTKMQSDNPELFHQYIDRARLQGELKAMKWYNRMVQEADQ